MTNVNFHAKLFMDVFCHMLGRIDGTMTTACASEGDLQMGEASLDETCHMEIDKFVDTVEEGEDFTIGFEEIDDRLVKPGERLVLFVTARIVGAAAVKDIASSVA